VDDETLRRVLANTEPPPPDEAAKKRAINLAVAAFGEESKKSAQGYAGFNRLRDMYARMKRRRSMNRTLVFGGMATTMTAMLVVGWTLYQDPNSRRFADQQLDRQEHPADEAADSKFAESKAVEKRAARDSAGAPAVVGENQMLSPYSSSPSMLAVSPRNREALPGRDLLPPKTYQDVGRDAFKDFEVNPVKVVVEEPVSTFSIDVDTASYSFVRRQLNRGLLPQKDAVRVEEMINYFDYAYPLPESRETPFRVTTELSPSPWAEGRELLHIGIKGYDVTPAERPRSNLIFLLDVSGSMNSPDKLPLLKTSMKMLLESLRPEDTVGIVTYTGAAGKVLDPTPVKEKAKILEALDRLQPHGSTAGAEGIRQAYELADANFDAEAVNRVILASDGDFNVGITSTEELKDFVERKRKSGIYLSVLGFGQGNLNDQLMQALAQNGNGVAAYIDTLGEARKVLVEEASGTLFPIAKDVKIQVEFNPATVAEYRLIGYETRTLDREDFRSDKVDAGELGSGHTVTAIYEITPVGGPVLVGESRYQQRSAPAAATDVGDELAFVKVRYKLADEDTSRLISIPVQAAPDLDANRAVKSPDRGREAGWATAVAAFGQILKGGEYTGDFDYDNVVALAQANKGDDPFGYRGEFIQLVRLAKTAAAMQQQER